MFKWAFVIIFSCLGPFVLADEEGWDVLIREATPEERIQQVRIYEEVAKPLFEAKCYVCHARQAEPPFYTDWPFLRGYFSKTRKEAQKELDMSVFPFKGHGRLKEDMEAIMREIREDKMPPRLYRLFHWRASMTQEEIELLELWMQKTLEITEH